MMLKSGSVWILCSLFLLLPITTRSDGVFLKQWCIADEQTPDDALQQAIDWACGKGGANCRMIRPHQPCYLPNTIRAHASYVFNSYWQEFKNKGGSCYFNSAAIITELDPSHGFCRFETLP